MKGLPFLILFFFFTFRFSGDSLGKTREEALEELQSLPYIGWVSDKTARENQFVTLHLSEKAFPGFNLFDVNRSNQIQLLDMNGKKVHEWRLNRKGKDFWKASIPLPNGDLVVALRDQSLVRLSFDSDIIWRIPLRVHHAPFLDQDGNIWAIFRKEEVVQWEGEPLPLLVDYIGQFTPDGKMQKSISLYEFLKDDLPEKRLRQALRWSRERDLVRKMLTGKSKRFTLNRDSIWDVFHANAIRVAPQKINGFCERGDVLVSVRNLDSLILIDRDLMKMKWKWGSGYFQQQHDPSFLPNGDILLFDNGRVKKRSRVVTLNPRKETLNLIFQSGTEFYTSWGGSVQALPNQSVLITDSGKGRVFEITADNKEVWEFLTPKMKDRENARKTLFEMRRYWDEETYPFLKKFK